MCVSMCISVHVQDSCKAARGIGSPEGGASAAGVRRPDGTPGGGDAIGRARTLRAAGSVPAQTGPGPARQRPRGGETQRAAEVQH